MSALLVEAVLSNSGDAEKVAEREIELPGPDAVWKPVSDRVEYGARHGEPRQQVNHTVGGYTVAQSSRLLYLSEGVSGLRGDLGQM